MQISWLLKKSLMAPTWRKTTPKRTNCSAKLRLLHMRQRLQNLRFCRADPSVHCRTCDVLRIWLRPEIAFAILFTGSFALLLNVPGFEPRALELIRERYPESDPIDLSCKWLRELTSDASPLLDHAEGADAMLLVDGLMRELPTDEIVKKLGSVHKRTISDAEGQKIKHSSHYERFLA